MMMLNASFIAGLTLIVVGLLGCAHSQRREAWSSKDSWFHAPDDWLRFRQGQSLPSADIVEVVPEMMTAAEEQVSEVPCVEVSGQRATELTGKRFAPRAGSSLFLVRAVYLNRGTGEFMVVPVGRELLVEHGSLGHSAVAMKRQPLVVRLQRKPDVVYVCCSMDE